MQSPQALVPVAPTVLGKYTTKHSRRQVFGLINASRKTPDFSLGIQGYKLDISIPLWYTYLCTVGATGTNAYGEEIRPVGYVVDVGPS